MSSLRCRERERGVAVVIAAVAATVAATVAVAVASGWVLPRGWSRGSPVGVATPAAGEALAGASIARRCASWTHAEAAAFEATCGAWWTSSMTRTTTRTRTTTTYTWMCAPSDEGTGACHGLGDRLAGIHGVWERARRDGAGWDVAWPAADALVRRSCLVAAHNVQRPNAWGGGEVEIPFSTNCTRVDEDVARARRETITFRGFNRVCSLPAKTCASMTPAEAFGCPMRALFELTDEFLDNHRVSLWINGKVRRDVSVGEAARALQEFTTVGVHFRLGDAVAFGASDRGNDNGDIAPPKTTTSAQANEVPFRCAATIESWIRLLDNTTSTAQRTRTRKGVKWFLASDAEDVRAWARASFGSRLVMLLAKPRHIATTSAAEDATALADTLAEWYLLSTTDYLVANRWTRSSKFHGRYSSFAKTARVYGLRSDVFDAHTCVRRWLPLEGIWDSSLCQPHRRFAPMEQPHLDPLASRGLRFPSSWVDDGVVSPSGLVERHRRHHSPGSP